MKSQIFYSDVAKQIEARITTLLNNQDAFMSSRTILSTRATGDAVESILSDSFEAIMGKWCVDYSQDFARRSMADFAFTDVDGFYYVIDVKTHRTDTKFNMPNLTSVRRLARLYEDDLNYFALIIASYRIEKEKALFSNVKFVPIEFLDWHCLTIGALGWGQIQIANSNRIEINPLYSRKRWMLEFCDAVLEFYPKEISKIASRVEEFEKLRAFWKAKPDVWK